MKDLKSTFVKLLLFAGICLLCSGCDAEQRGVTIAVLIGAFIVGVITYNVRTESKRIKSSKPNPGSLQAPSRDNINVQKNQPPPTFRQNLNPSTTNNNELVELSKSINALHIQMNEFLQLYWNNPEPSEYKEDFLVHAYVAQKGVIDRMYRNGWSTNSETGIYVPVLDLKLVPLGSTVLITIEKLRSIAMTLDMEEQLDEIMNKGPIYYEVERIIPKDILDRL
jgi:hypothetical protein